MSAPDLLPAGDAAGPLDPDDFFAILKNRRRRFVIEYLTTRGDPATLRELSEYVTAREGGTPRETVTAEERRSVHVSLYQSHLPKMDCTAVVTFDRDRNLVSSGPALSQFEPYLPDESGSAEMRSWVWLYPGFVAAGLLLILLSPLRITAYGLTVARAALVMAAAVGFLVASHLLADRRRVDHRRVP